MLITYVFNNINIEDEHQLDLFFDTYTPAEVFYNSLNYKNSILKLYTQEDAYSEDTLTLFSEILLKYPNPPITLISRHVHNIDVPGNITTFDSVLKSNIKTPVGLPGQILVADPRIRTGFTWQFPSTDASNGVRSHITDLYMRYLDVHDSTGSQLVSGTPISINYNRERRVDPAYIHNMSNSSVITLVDSGIYTFNYQVGVQWLNIDEIPNFDALIHAYIEVTAPGNNEPTKLISSDIFLTLPSNVTSIFKTSNYSQFTYQSIAGGETLSCKIKEISQSNNVITSPDLNEISGIKFIIDDPINDQSEYFNIYDSVGDIEIGSNWTDIPMTANSLIGDYSHFELQNDGTFLSIYTPEFTNFFICFKSALKVVGATIGNSIRCKVKMVFDAGGGWTDVPGADINPIIFNITSTSWDVMKTYSFVSVLAFPPNTLMKFCAQVESNDGNGVVKTIQNCSVCNVIYPFGALTNQSVGRAFVGLNTNPIDITSNYWVDIPLDNAVIIDNIFLQNPDKKYIISSDTGTYQLVYRISITDTLSSNPGMVTARIVVNSGNGFLEVSGSRVTICYQGDNKVFGFGASMMYLGYNYQTKLQIIVENAGPNTSSAATCIPYDCNLMIFKFEKTIEPIPLPGMNIFGNFYTVAANLNADVTYQTEYIEKLLLVTPSVTNGKYRIIWTFNWSMASTIDQFIASIKLDDNEIKNFTNTTILPYKDNMYTDFRLIVMEGGSHEFRLLWKTSNANVAAFIKDAKMEFLKIS